MIYYTLVVCFCKYVFTLWVIFGFQFIGLFFIGYFGYDLFILFFIVFLFRSTGLAF